MNNINKKAFEIWKKNHSWNSEFIPLMGDFLKKKPIVCFYNEGDYMPYSVQYAGNGHYFKTEGEMYIYYKKRLMEG